MTKKGRKHVVVLSLILCAIAILGVIVWHAGAAKWFGFNAGDNGGSNDSGEGVYIPRVKIGDMKTEDTKAGAGLSFFR